MTDVTFETVDAPALDETPTVVAPNGDFDPAYPGSTPEAPYGFKDDGTPYKRRPRGTAGNATASVGRRMPASDNQAAMAAAVLARINALVGFSLMSLGMPATMEALAESNKDFETMAKEALLTDPALCRKILSAGTSSGKTQLFMAYGILAASVAPAAYTEIKIKRAERQEYVD